MTSRVPLLIAALLALGLSAAAQQTQESGAAAPIGSGSGQGYLLEGAGMLQQGATATDTATSAAAPESKDPFDDVKYIGGPETQAGDPDAGDEPVRRIVRKKTTTDVFRNKYSISVPKAEPEESPIVKKAREFMSSPPYNPNNGTRNWAGWCLGFVNTTLRAVRGRGDAQMAQPAAKNAYYAMAAAGRISKDFRNVPSGAALLWSGCSQWGHAAIATGEMSADGTPIMVTTSHKGIREMSTKQFGCGLPTGWGKI